VFLWETGTGELLTDQDQTGLCGGLKEVLVTDTNGCQQLVQLTVISPAPIQIDADILQYNGFDVTCPGVCNGSMTIVPSGQDGPFLVSWINPVFPDGETQTGLCPGDYEVLVTDSRNCIETEIFTIDEPTPVVATVLSSHDCDTGITTLCVNPGGGTGTYVFGWSDGLGDPGCITPTDDGEYCVDVTDSNGCETQACITVIDPELLVISGEVTNTTCAQNNGAIDVTIDSGTGPFSLVWTGNGVVQG
ncbi:MAG: hypothetical protein ACK54P_04880, partial [Bacteroidota bacterium]